MSFGNNLTRFVALNDSGMLTVHPQYITDHTGRRTSVLLSVKDFQAIMEELEELEDIKRYYATKKSNEASIPVEDAFNMIEAKRKAKPWLIAQPWRGKP